MGRNIVVVGTLDTKGEDISFLKKRIDERGFKTLVIDAGVMRSAQYTADVSAETVAWAGGGDLDALREEGDRGKALHVMTEGVAAVVKDLNDKEQVGGIVSLGGGGGTALGTSAMRALPIGVPKVMVSTIASGNTEPYVQTTDIVMVPSIVDISGVNRISEGVYRRAAAMVCAMAEVSGQRPRGETPTSATIAASMFGNTTRAVNDARSILVNQDHEVLVFHATGIGGKTMETLLRDGYFDGVLDVTTTELADEICGGVLTAGPERLTAAGKKGIPQVVVPGCIDMCNFWGEDIPKHYEGRLFYEWNPNVTLMRTDISENGRIAELMAHNLNESVGPVEVYVPLKGFSELDIPNGPFWWPEANAAFTDTLREHLDERIPVYRMGYNVNDGAFSAALADAMARLMVK